MTPETMLRMANQITDFFSGYPHDEAVEGVANHLRKFWEPRMRKMIIEYAENDGTGLKPITLEAVGQLKK